MKIKQDNIVWVGLELFSVYAMQGVGKHMPSYSDRCNMEFKSVFYSHSSLRISIELPYLSI